ncbi:class I SAM-dependent methyltransferase [Aquirhabdus parva]|uniref:Class I SAM-dependent methyltransferase n=1 Tax=Aquirhabdus parva TaxID=2283318 RepID=A0A345P386_9GAMM|nr:class I SAM-dependent methyltransferase [Aquirhabdus parva]AXI01745.1 hypothetical protein HYN46_01875 [Aquirhabdus parva]
MDTNKDNVAVSALYTAGTWQWAGLPGSDAVTPADSERVFSFVNRYMVFYTFLNPKTFSLRHQLLHRHTAIDYLREQSGCTRTVEVACGFSPRGASVSADPAQEYIEIDLPDMITFKERQLQKSAEGRQVLARDNFKLRPDNILTLDFVANFADRRTAVITEGLMMYFTREQQLPIWQSIARLVNTTDGVYLFDYIPLSEEPARSWLGAILHFFRVKLFGKGDFAYDQRNREDVAQDLRASGFGQVESFITGEVASLWNLPQANVPSRTIIYRCSASSMAQIATEEPI